MQDRAQQRKPRVKTTASESTDEALAQEIERGLVDRHGPVLGARVLYQVLGYPSAAALRQALLRGTVTIPVFDIPNRRGRFALARDVAAWLVKCRATATTENSSGVKTKAAK